MGRGYPWIDTQIEPYQGHPLVSAVENFRGGDMSWRYSLTLEAGFVVRHRIAL